MRGREVFLRPAPAPLSTAHSKEPIPKNRNKYSQKICTAICVVFKYLFRSMHCDENVIYVFFFWELRSHSPNFHIHVSVSVLYIPTIDLPVLLQEICGPILGIYKSLTDTWMWKLGPSEAAQFTEKENINDIFVAVHASEQIFKTTQMVFSSNSFICFMPLQCKKPFLQCTVNITHS